MGLRLGLFVFVCGGCGLHDKRCHRARSCIATLRYIKARTCWSLRLPRTLCPNQIPRGRDVYVQFPFVFGSSDRRSLPRPCCFFVFHFPILPFSANSDSLSWPGCAAKIHYSDHITPSPQVVDILTRSPPPLQRTVPDFDDEGGHHSPSHPVPHKSKTDEYPRRGRTSAQSTRRRMTYGGRATGMPNFFSTQGQGASPSTTMLQRARTGFSNLLVPGHKVGKPPGFVREMKTILFGSCASCCPIFLECIRRSDAVC